MGRHEARAADPPAPAKKAPPVAVGGYLRPGFGFRFRADALPRDVFDYGFFGNAALIVEARPVEMWRARVHLDFSSAALRAVTDVGLFDVNGDGAPDGITYSTADVPGAVLQEATVRFAPHRTVELCLGAMRIPFTLSQQSANAALMFPTRAAANEVFLSGADLGARVSADLFDGVALVSAGAFNGDSLGLTLDHVVARGVVLAARTDVSPFGRFDFGESDLRRGPFRLGAGFGVMVRPTTLYDERTGTEPRSVTDTRLAASLRMAVRGLYFAAEYFRRVQTDDFSSRPELADGAYGQVAFFYPPLSWLGLEPIVRAGFVAYDQTFDPRLVAYLEAGLNLYPAAGAKDPGVAKVTLQYLGERRVTEDEDAHGAALAVQLGF